MNTLHVKWYKCLEDHIISIIIIFPKKIPKWYKIGVSVITDV